MRNSAIRRKRSACAIVAASALTIPGSVLAASADTRTDDAAMVPAQFEKNLGRGLAAATTEDGVFVSWRLLGGETTGATDTGMMGPDFALYRDGEKIATVTNSTNYLDPDGTSGAEYAVAPIANGVELEKSRTVTPWDADYASLPLQKPEGGRTPAGVLHPDGEDYGYSANDMSVADVDGDGEYEYIVKWYPSNAKDVSHKGYTGSTIIDTYEADGTLLHRIDLGKNIRSGAHYTQFMVEDFDGDGKAEIMMKTAPGTTVTSADATTPITIPADDIAAGVSHNADYRWSAADYADHLATVFQSWGEREEVASGEWPASIEKALGREPQYDLPLSDADAKELADWYIDEYAPARNSKNKLRDFEGFVLSGPEYLTVFDGATGKELDTVDYVPPRGDDGLEWADYAGGRIEPGNRVDRFLAGVANLDGHSLSAIFARGYYKRSVIAAYDWDGEHLRTRWVADSGKTPMDNPWNGPAASDGTDPDLGAFAGQGFHTLSVADVDSDGRQEIVYGGATLDDDGSLLYSSTGVTPPDSADPGVRKKLGHGDAMHVADIVPERPGLEIFTVHEGSTAPYGWALRDAATGEIIDGEYGGTDVGRGMVGDIDPDRPGLEFWSSISEVPEAGGSLPSTNFSIRWTPDMTTRLIAGFEEDDRDTYENVRIENGDAETVRTLEGTRSNNSTKGTPSLVADVMGDWREELLVRDVDSSEIRIYMSTDLTDRKLTTLMHDPQYRVEVARQNTAYNQPSYPSYMLASDIDYAQVPVFTTPVEAAAPEIVEKPGRSRDGYVIPDVDHVTYYVNGKPAEPGFHRARRTVQIAAVADAWFRADGEASWSYAFRAE